MPEHSRFLTIPTHVWLITCVLLFGTGTANGQQPKHVALVIGNSDYDPHNVSLKNPSNDADAVSKTLTDAGFEVNKLKNVTRSQFENAVDQVTSNLSRGDLCMIFFAGHGLEMDGENYLVPVGTEVTQPQHVKERCVNLSYLLTSLRFSGCSLKVVIVDACRNNPFRSMRSASAGVARVQAPEGTIVSFSTSPRTGALDGEGDNSPFTAQLVRAMRGKADKLEIVRLFREVSQAVRKETGQSPYLEFDASMPDYFIQPKSAESPPLKVTNAASPEETVQVFPKESFPALSAIKGNQTTSGDTNNGTPPTSSDDGVTWNGEPPPPSFGGGVPAKPVDVIPQLSYDEIFKVTAVTRITLKNNSTTWPLHYRVGRYGRRRLDPGGAAAVRIDNFQTAAMDDTLEIYVGEEEGWKTMSLKRGEETGMDFRPSGKSWTHRKTPFAMEQWEQLAAKPAPLHDPGI